MKLRNYFVLMVVVTVSIVFAPVSPCKAGWQWLNSDESSGPWYGYNYDSGAGYQLEEYFQGTNINTDADSSGCSASADLEASCSVEVSSTGGSISKSASAWCSAWGESNYIYTKDDPNDTPDDLYVEWDIDGSGTVSVSGEVITGSLNTGDSADASSNAYSDLDGGEEYGGGYASGSVSETGSGSADTELTGEATEDSSSETEITGSYSATLSWSVDANDTYTLENYWQYTSEAELNVSVSSSASVDVTQGYSGSALAGADADCSGTSSVDVSW